MQKTQSLIEQESDPIKMERSNESCSFRNSSSFWIVVSTVTMWTSVAFVSITTKCLLTSASCTRWGPDHGANFGHVFSTATLHLLVVGASLAFLLTVHQIRWYWSSFLQNKNNGGASQSMLSVPLINWTAIGQKIQTCAWVGTSFGLKTVLSHAALQQTPTAVFEAFHGLNIAFIALAAWCVLGERPSTWAEIGTITGVVVGSTLTSSASFFESKDFGGIMALLLNLGNGVLAGVVVATLRWTTLQMEGTHMTILELTCLKCLIGATVVLPVCLIVEGNAMLLLTSMQLKWLLISSALYMVYHLNLTLLCALAPALVVGVVEGLKLLPAFVLVTLVQQMPPTSVLFWVGTGITMACAILFKLSRTTRTQWQKYADPKRPSEQHLLLSHADSACESTSGPKYHAITGAHSCNRSGSTGLELEEGRFTPYSSLPRVQGH